jgi:hypothetical protein
MWEGPEKEFERRSERGERVLMSARDRLLSQRQKDFILVLCHQLGISPPPGLDFFTVEQADRYIKDLIRAKEVHK